MASQPSTGSASIVPLTGKLLSSTSSSAPSARTPSTANHSDSYEQLADTIEAIKESYRAVTERERLTEPVEALRDPTYLETLRTHRSLLDRARQALRRIVKMPEHFRAAAHAGITREGLVDWIQDYADRQREFNAAAATPRASQSEHLEELEAQWHSIADAAERQNILPLHVPGWRVTVDRISAAVEKRTIPETSQRVFNSILEDQRTAYRYDRQARNLIRLIGETHECQRRSKNVLLRRRKDVPLARQ